MDRPDNPVERAFQLARSGKFSALNELKARLNSEGYSVATIEGPSLAKQLRDLIKTSQETRA
jgi:thymidylate kinase